jgi:hypothetical protein
LDVRRTKLQETVDSRIMKRLVMGGACSIHKRNEKCILTHKLCWKTLREETTEETDANGKIIVNGS